MMISNARLKVTLLPWDPSSQPHREALVQQRKDCGWHHDKIEKWKGEQEKGGKCMYWIVSIGLATWKDDFHRNSNTAV